MMLVPAGIKAHIAVGYTDLRKGLDGLAVLVEQVLEKDPFSGHMFVFRGKRAHQRDSAYSLRCATIAYRWHPLFGRTLQVSPFRRGKDLKCIYKDERPDLCRELAERGDESIEAITGRPAS